MILPVLSHSFRDLTRFVVFLMIWQALVATGYGQQAQNSSAGSAAALASKNAPAALAASKPLNGKVVPLVQTADFRSVIAVSRSLSALSVGAVTNSTVTIT